MSETIIATLVGGGLAILGGVVGVFAQYAISKKERKHKDKKEAYETAMKFLSQVAGQVDTGNALNDFFNANIKIHLYGTKEIAESFEQVVFSYLPEDKRVEISKSALENEANHPTKRLEEMMKNDLTR